MTTDGRLRKLERAGVGDCRRCGGGGLYVFLIQTPEGVTVRDVHGTELATVPGARVPEYGERWAPELWPAMSCPVCGKFASKVMHNFDPREVTRT